MSCNSCFDTFKIFFFYFALHNNVLFNTSSNGVNITISIIFKLSIKVNSSLYINNTISKYRGKMMKIFSLIFFNKLKKKNNSEVPAITSYKRIHFEKKYNIFRYNKFFHERRRNFMQIETTVY